ncbi:unnamed protein product [Auanema sp. JU1783]|jgi:hypothetical protein|nr:unnamed protein product [Auanema sp. JU1783]
MIKLYKIIKYQADQRLGSLGFRDWVAVTIVITITMIGLVLIGGELTPLVDHWTVETPDPESRPMETPAVEETADEQEEYWTETRVNGVLYLMCMGTIIAILAIARYLASGE